MRWVGDAGHGAIRRHESEPEDSRRPAGSEGAGIVDAITARERRHDEREQLPAGQFALQREFSRDVADPPIDRQAVAVDIQAQHHRGAARGPDQIQ